jgi:hypothetical protein
LNSDTNSTKMVKLLLLNSGVDIEIKNNVKYNNYLLLFKLK